MKDEKPTIHNEFHFHAPVGQNIAHVDTLNVTFDKDMKMQVLDVESMPAPDLRTALDQLLPLVTKKRLWFSVAKALMWQGYVNDGDFFGAETLVTSCYPEGVPVSMDAADLTKLNVLSFRKPLEQWEVTDAPVQKLNLFQQYFDLAERAMAVIPPKVQ